MMRSAWWLAMLLACGGNETADPGNETSTEAATTMRSRAVGENTEVDPEVEAPRPNRSAGPARSGFNVVPQRMHRQFVMTLEVFGRHAAAGTARGMVTLFDVPSGHVRAARRLFFGPVVDLTVSEDRKRMLAIGSSTGEDDSPTDAVVWDLETDRVWVASREYALNRALSPNGRYVVTIPENAAEEPIEIQLGEVWGARRTRRIDDVKVASNVFFAHDSRTLHLIGDGRARTFAVPGLRPRGEGWEVPAGPSAPHPTEDLIAIGSGQTITIHALADGEKKFELSAATRIERLTWSPDGSRLAVCGRRGDGQVFSGDGYATVNDMPSGCDYSTKLDLVAETPATIRNSRAGLSYLAVGSEEAIELQPSVASAIAFPPRAGWFIYGNSTDVYIANMTRRRSRRLVRGGAGEYSAWSTTADDDAITLRGRGWSHRFGAAAEEAEEAEEADSPTPTPAVDAGPPSFPGVDDDDAYFDVLATSEDHKHRLVLLDPTGEPRAFLLNTGEDGEETPVALREPAGEGFGMYCGLDYDEEYGEETYYCDSVTAFAPDASSFVIGGAEGTASFDVTGRRLGTSGGIRWVRYIGDSKLLVHAHDGALFVAGTNLRRSGVVFRARERVSAYATVNDDQTYVAATRGAALAIYDIAGNTRAHLVRLPSPAQGTPVFEDGLIQVRVRDAFIWYQIEDGVEARKVELDEIRAINDDRTRALTCAEDRLRHVEIARPNEGMDLGPCPLDAREMGFDDSRIWWVEGSRGHVVRLSDAEHMIVGVYQLRTPLLYAFTPRGHFWTDRPDALRSLRVRMPGPVLDADNPVPEASWVRESLVADFLADRDLGDAPER